MLIDCDGCALQHTEACDDCVVTFLLDRPAGPVALDSAEASAVRNLQVAGLAPASRYQPAEPSPGP